MKTPPKKTTTSKIVRHDSITVAAAYPTGGKFRFHVSRSGERLTVWGASGPEGNKQSKILANWIQFREKETNGQRADRIRRLCAAASGIGHLVKLVLAENSTAVTKA